MFNDKDVVDEHLSVSQLLRHVKKVPVIRVTCSTETRQLDLLHEESIFQKSVSLSTS